MSAPVPDLTKVVVGTGFMWTAPAPLRVPEPMPADTISYGADWAGLWKYIGGTIGGVAVSAAPKMVSINIEEQSSDVDTKVDTQTIKVTAELSEETVNNLKLSFGGGIVTTVAAASGIIGKSTLALSDNKDLLSVGVDLLNSFGFFTRYYVPIVRSTGTLNVKMLRAKAQRSYMLELTAICPINQIQIVTMTAAALP
jgi:hypothetical protein